MTPPVPSAGRANRVRAGQRAQRAGDSFENSVEAANVGYAMQNTALVERLRLTGRFVKGKGFTPGHSPVDFQGDIRVGDRFIPVRFDCKSFEGDAWKFSEWNPATKKNKVHQLTALRHMARFGGLAFVLVRQNTIAIVDSGLVVDKKTGGGGAWHSFGHPAWLVPLSVVEGCIRKGQWSMHVAELDARSEFVDSTRTVRMRGGDWLEAARSLVKEM